MRQSPELSEVEERMRPGVLTLDGFLGNDRRSLAQILDEDANTVNRLALTHGGIADRLQQFLHAGRKGLGTTVAVEDRWEVRVESVRGFLPCPWPHAGVFRKENAYMRRTDTEETLTWTALTVHMIRAHGFYEGRGSRFRVEPEAAARILEL